ncbi:MAG TPA: 3-deoxy-7-phosphoheptulonate synthase, partial [Chromatiales bacterium]|nr:3-deoxy-7-phosphoheptulonate synthase [Chromatiales bacterium]HEX21977.1 3-deoxy-7-phosphoheptulonate synthase [Chromatiales bacterium]
MPTKYETDDLRIKAIKEVVAPAEVLAEHPISDTAAETTATTRQAIH